MPRNQRALKAQKFIAWGNAPGIVPPWAMRAVGAKVAVGVTPAGVTVTMGLLVSIIVTIGIVSQCNAYGYFYRTQVAPRLSAQAHGARLALLLHKAGCASAI